MFAKYSSRAFIWFFDYVLLTDDWYVSWSNMQFLWCRTIVGRHFRRKCPQAFTHVWNTCKQPDINSVMYKLSKDHSLKGFRVSVSGLHPNSECTCPMEMHCWSICHLCDIPTHLNLYFHISFHWLVWMKPQKLQYFDLNYLYFIKKGDDLLKTYSFEFFLFFYRINTSTDVSNILFPLYEHQQITYVYLQMFPRQYVIKLCYCMQHCVVLWVMVTCVQTAELCALGMQDLLSGIEMAILLHAITQQKIFCL